jgi:hypothetical protein
MGDLANIKNNLPAEIADVFDADELAGDLYDGIQAGFAVVSIRGSRWRISKGGDAEAVVNADGDPVASLECVIVKASRNVSKIYYQEDYAEGDAEAPDCWSVDGITPDAGSGKPQSKTCATCKQNVWGSKITPAGKKTKACGDNRRIAIVPLADILNKKYDGAMLLRVPAASLADLALYGKGMAGKGFPYNAVGTKMGFDLEASYPKLTFRPIRPLTEEQLAQVAEVSRSPQVQAILEVASENAAPAAAPAEAKPEPAATVSLDFEDESEPETSQEQAEVEEAVQKAPAKKAATKKAATKKSAKPKQEPEEEAEIEVEESAPTQSDEEDSLDELLADLDSLG